MSFDPWHVTRSPPIGKRIELGGMYNNFTSVIDVSFGFTFFYKLV